MNPKACLLPLLLIAALHAEIPDPFPEDSPETKTEKFVSGGVSIFGAGLGIQYREDEHFDCGLRLQAFPILWSVDGHIQFHARNPGHASHFYWGPELIFMHEDDHAGEFNLAFLNADFGREHRLSQRWRIAYEGGPGVMLFYSYKGAGAPILLPFDIGARAQVLYQVL
jgi:hypothetical protein